MIDSFTPHEIEWTPELVARFWDYQSRTAAASEDYFSRQVGRGIAALVQRLAPPPRRLLDYGCGPGYLIEHLLAAGYTVAGCDYSGESLRRVDAQFRGRAGWQGCARLESGTLPYSDGSFDLVVSVETLEHLLAPQVDPLLAEWQRILDPKAGELFVTVPNAEDLARSTICCPTCGSLFHRYQHIRSFDRSRLAALFEGRGGVTRLCTATDFARFQRPLFAGRRPSAVVRSLHWAALRGLDRLGWRGQHPGGRLVRTLCSDGPHLFWFGSPGRCASGRSG